MPRTLRSYTGLAFVGAICSLPHPGTAQCSPECPPQGNASLTVPGRAVPGAPVNLYLRGARRCLPALIGASVGAGPLCLPWGKVCLSAPIVAVSGCTPLDVTAVVPAGTPAQTAVHFQGLVLDRRAPNGFVALSRSRRLITLSSPTAGTTKRGQGTASPSMAPFPALAAEHVIYTDLGVFDTLGSYFGGQGQILMAEQTNNAVAPEGVRYMQASFSLPAAGGWAGLFVQVGAFNTPNKWLDVRSYRPDGYLRFYIRSKVELEVGVRSSNITPGQEKAKFLLRKSGYAKLNGRWESVAIPLSTFKRLEPRLDFAKMKVVFGLAVTTAFVSAPSGVFDFDAVRISY